MKLHDIQKSILQVLLVNKDNNYGCVKHRIFRSLKYNCFYNGFDSYFRNSVKFLTRQGLIINGFYTLRLTAYGEKIAKLLS